MKRRTAGCRTDVVEKAVEPYSALLGHIPRGFHIPRDPDRRADNKRLMCPHQRGKRVLIPRLPAAGMKVGVGG